MFDVTTIQNIAISAGNSLVGWKQPTKFGSVVLDAILKTSRSGLTFETGSRIVSVDNIKNSIEDELATDEEVNTELKNIVKEAFAKTLNSIFNEDDFKGGGLLFKHETDKQTIELPTNSFVGFEINTRKANDLSIVITRLLLNFDADQSVKVLLFSSEKKAAIYSSTISALQDDTVAEEINWILSNYKYGGKFYLGYLTSSITANPIARNYELANLQTSFNNVDIQPIQVVHNAETMFDPNDVVYSDSSTSWGINLDMQSYEDWTQTINSNQRMFARCLVLQVAVDVADLLLHSVRSNGIEVINKSAIVFELNGNVNNAKMPEKIGLFKLLAIEEKRLRNTFNPKGIVKMTLR